MTGEHVREWSLVLGVGLVYSLVRGLGAPEQAAVAVENAAHVVALERSLGLLVEASLQELVLELPGALAGLKVYYLAMHLPPIAAALGWVYVCRPRAWPRFRDTMIAFTLLAGLVHVLVPLAPPWFVDGLAVRDVFGKMHAGGLSASTLGNPFAAMPSMHFGWALGAGLALFLLAEHALARVFGLLHPVVMGLAIVVTGNHYVLDGLASALLLGLCFLAVERLRRGSGVLAPRRGGREAPEAGEASSGVTSGRPSTVGRLRAEVSPHR